MSIKSAMRGVAVPLLEDEADDEVTSEAIAIPNSFHNHKVSVTGSAGVASGVVTVESAPTADYAGTWSQVTNPVTVVAETTIEVIFTGIFQAIRTRISTAIGSGTVSTEYIGS